MATPPVPPSLKAVAHYVKIGLEHEKRDPVIYYWCLYYSCQAGMKIDKSSPPAKQFLGQMLGLLEKVKQENKSNEAITNDIVAQAHIEGVALKLFEWADAEDRASNFNKNTVKAFYTCGYLFDILALFGEEFDPQVAEKRKYAKWKAAYIHNCLKNGEMPQPGPLVGENDELELGAGGGGGNIGFVPGPSMVVPPSNTGFEPEQHHAPAPVPAPRLPSPAPVQPAAASVPAAAPSSLGIDKCVKAQKYCKWASSALEYEDVGTAVANLEKALQLLKTGSDA